MAATARAVAPRRANAHSRARAPTPPSSASTRSTAGARAPAPPTSTRAGGARNSSAISAKFSLGGSPTRPGGAPGGGTGLPPPADFHQGVGGAKLVGDFGEILHVRPHDDGFPEQRRLQDIVSPSRRQRSAHEHAIGQSKQPAEF